MKRIIPTRLSLNLFNIDVFKNKATEIKGQYIICGYWSQDNGLSCQ